MASAFARTLPASLSSRTIFVKCSPVPLNYTERRAVLKALNSVSKDSEIEVFKKLEDNSSFIAVTATRECAKTLVSESPYRRVLHLQYPGAAARFSTAAWGAAYRSTITDPVNIQPLEESGGESKVAGNTPERSDRGLKSKTFTIYVFPGNADYNHRGVIKTNRLHGPWPRNDGYSTFISNALMRSVPRDYMSPGLRDWETGDQLSEEPAGFEDEGAQSLVGQARRKAFFIEERKRKKETEIPDVMKRLAAVAHAVHPPEAPETPAGDESMAEDPTARSGAEHGFSEEMPMVDDEALWTTLSRRPVPSNSERRAIRKTVVDENFRWDQLKSTRRGKKSWATENGHNASSSASETQEFSQRPAGVEVSEIVRDGFVWDLPSPRKESATKGKAGKSITDDRVTLAEFEAVFSGDITRNSSTTTGVSRDAVKNAALDIGKRTKQNTSKKSGKGQSEVAANERLSPNQFHEQFGRL